MHYWHSGCKAWTQSTATMEQPLVETSRVCLVTEIFHPEDQGGQGRQAFALARRLRAHGAVVSVATRRNFVESTASEVLEGIRIERLPPTGLLKGKGWRAVPPTLWFLATLFVHLMRRRGSYDVILVQGVKAVLLPTLLAAWLLDKRCIVKVDAVAELEQELTPESLAQMKLREGSTIVRLWARLRDALLRRTHATVAISSEIEAALKRRLGDHARVVRIPNGLEFDDAAPCDRRELRRRLLLPDGLLAIYTGGSRAPKACRCCWRSGLPSLARTPTCTWSSLAAAIARSTAASRNCESTCAAMVSSRG